MPYRAKITDIVEKGSVKYVGSESLMGRTHRLYKATGRIYHEDIVRLVEEGYRMGCFSDGSFSIARPSQLRSYKTE